VIVQVNCCRVSFRRGSKEGRRRKCSRHQGGGAKHHGKRVSFGWLGASFPPSHDVYFIYHCFSFVRSFRPSSVRCSICYQEHV